MSTIGFLRSAFEASWSSYWMAPCCKRPEWAGLGSWMEHAHFISFMVSYSGLAKIANVINIILQPFWSYLSKHPHFSCNYQNEDLQRLTELCCLAKLCLHSLPGQPTASCTIKHSKTYSFKIIMAGLCEVFSHSSEAKLKSQYGSK